MNKFSKLIITMISINIIILFYLLITYDKKIEKVLKEELKYQGVSLVEETNIDKSDKNLVYIKNVSVISNFYNVNTPIVKISIKIEDFINNILNSSIETSNLETFYEENKSKIKDYTYATTKEEFKEFIQLVLGKNTSRIVEAEILNNSVNRKNDIIYAKIKLKFENNNECILTLEINEELSKVKIS